MQIRDELQDRAHIAVIIPCYNEEATIAEVVHESRIALPNAFVYVCDNHCTDDTAKLALKAGARVIYEPHRGKGCAVARLLKEVDADIYVMLDGDGTYPLAHVQNLIEAVASGRADMAVGARRLEDRRNSFRPFHRFGNALVTGVINLIFRASLKDVMSGYRVFSRDFARSLPLLSRGFEIETQMSIQALYYQFRIVEYPVEMRDRPRHSPSKLRTFRDGTWVLLSIVNALKAYRPLLFFSLLSAATGMVGTMLTAFAPSQADYFFMGGAFLLMAAIVLMACGIVLDTINHRLRELGQLVTQRTAGGPAHPPK